MSRSLPNGAFTRRYGARKNWRVDERLFQAICAVLTDAHSVIDLGAGTGHYVRRLREAGFDAIGVDGIPKVHHLSEGRVIWADLTRPLLEPSREWAISIEVGEHIPCEGESAFLDNLTKAATTGLIVSWAVPGQRGLNHINCRPPSYIVEQLGRRAWRLSVSETANARQIAGRNWSQKLLVLRHISSDCGHP